MHSRSNLVFAVTLLVTAAVALLPAGWRLGWSSDLARIVRFPLRPFSDFSNRMTGEGADEDRSDLERLQEDIEYLQHLLQRERMAVGELEERLREVHGVPASVWKWAKSAVFGYITARNPDSPYGIVELRVEPGSAIPADESTIAVYRSVHLLGRLVDEGRPSVPSLLPVVNTGSGEIWARIFPQEDHEIPAMRAERVALAPTGTGAFTGQIDRAVPVQEGDVVRVDDALWPHTAQMLELGEVESIEVYDREPLRNTITVRPRYQVREVSSVMLIVQSTADAEPAGEETSP
ncbi:MAG: hypothetical protein GY715_06490 [Planctomycetes bacterium]|nr:hypothetical protein [Planctomycetota bacterium]